MVEENVENLTTTQSVTGSDIITPSITTTEEVTRTHKITVTIDDETWNRLWNLVKKRYTSTWRAYANEVRKALKEYLDREEGK